MTFEVFEPSDPRTQSLQTLRPRDTPRPFLLFSFISFISLIIPFAFRLCLTYICHILTFNRHLMVPYMLVHILDCASRTILILSSSDPLLVVFGSLVQSGFLTPRAIDRNHNWSFYFQILKKTGPNQCGLVHIGFLQLQDWS